MALSCCCTRTLLGEKEMEGKLHEVAIAGDPVELDKLLQEDPDILERCAAKETPLHIAAQLGHEALVAKIGSLKPEFAHAKNSEGRSPLHLASAKGHAGTVKKLLEINSDVCFSRDQDGMTSLHIAAIKGRIPVLEKLAEKIKAAWVFPDCGQPILHLCANHDKFDALELIIRSVKEKEKEKPAKLVEFMNLKDDDDNTILHLLAAKAHSKEAAHVIEYLFPKDQSKNVFGVDVNAINRQGSTALDVLYKNCGPLDRMRIKFRLGGGAKRAADIPESKSHAIERSMWDFLFERKNEERSETRDTRDALLVVAALIATVTFQAQISPPGGVWQDDASIRFTDKANHTQEIKKKVYAGNSVMAFNYARKYSFFTTFNFVGFVASLVLILLLVGGFTLRRKASTLILTGTTWIATISMLVVFGLSLSPLKDPPTRVGDTTITTNWFGFGGIVTFMILLPLIIVVTLSGINYIWSHLREPIIWSVPVGFRRLFRFHYFSNSSQRDSQGRIV